MNQKSLIIVESPSKARTIEQYLDGEFEVVACVGHVKDLPSSKLGIDIENNFEMTLDVLPNRKDFIKELRKKSKSAKKYFMGWTNCFMGFLSVFNIRLIIIWTFWQEIIPEQVGNNMS